MHFVRPHFQKGGFRQAVCFSPSSSLLTLPFTQLCCYVATQLAAFPPPLAIHPPWEPPAKVANPPRLQLSPSPSFAAG